MISQVAQSLKNDKCFNLWGNSRLGLGHHLNKKGKSKGL